MKIREFIERGRELYAVCHGYHGEFVGPRTIALDFSQFAPEMNYRELRGKLRCSVCGTSDPGKILLIKPPLQREGEVCAVVFEEVATACEDQQQGDRCQKNDVARARGSNQSLATAVLAHILSHAKLPLPHLRHHRE